MTARNKFLMTLSALLILATSGCTAFRAPEPEVRTEYIIQQPNIPIPPRPRAVDLVDVEWRVVTKDNLEEFIQQLENDRGTVVFAAITIDDYEALALNVAELRRYIEQQQELIVYYERAVTDPE